MKSSSIKVFILLSLLSLILTSCAGGKNLRTTPSTAESISGIFDVTFYSNQDYDGLKQIVILDLVDDAYEIVLYEPKYYMQTVKHAKGDDAEKSAVEFLKDHPNYINYKINKILDKEGNAIGFEIRPLYAPATYGITDVMQNYYTLEDDGKVRATITLKGQIRRIFEQDRR
jgi:hypothetical protein